MIYAIKKDPSDTIDFHIDGYGTFDIKLDVNT